MRKTAGLAAAALAALWPGAPRAAAVPEAGDAPVTRALAPLRAKFDMPAMAGAVVDDSGVRLIGAVGLRKRGGRAGVRLGDVWHLGSETKAMTAALVARLVEKGKLRWDETLADVFPDLAAGMDPAFRAVTLTQLLSHRAGLPENVDWGSYAGTRARALRLKVVRDVLAKPPQSAPGTRYAYSNVGYVIAGAAVERVTRESWEKAIRSEVFAPLGMRSCGFGPVSQAGPGEPWPHGADGRPAAKPDVDNPPVMGPAGRVHCSLGDWGKFVADQLRGARGRPGLLSAASYRTMQTPPSGGDYALGWFVAKRDWAGGTALNHAGSNTLNYANAWLAPGKGFAILVTINQGGDAAFNASDAAVGALLPMATAPR